MCAKSSLRKSGKVVMTFLILVESVSCQWLASADSVGLANAGPYTDSNNEVNRIVVCVMCL